MLQQGESNEYFGFTVHIKVMFTLQLSGGNKWIFKTYLKNYIYTIL